MHIATITSMIHPRLTDAGIEGGFFELEVHVRMDKALASGDPEGFVQKILAEHLASCVASTGLPLKESCWQVIFTRWAQTNLNYPEGFVT